jgi:hypothetical protein
MSPKLGRNSALPRLRHAMAREIAAPGLADQPAHATRGLSRDAVARCPSRVPSTRHSARYGVTRPPLRGAPQPGPAQRPSPPFSLSPSLSQHGPQPLTKKMTQERRHGQGQPQRRQRQWQRQRQRQRQPQPQPQRRQRQRQQQCPARCSSRAGIHPFVKQRSNSGQTAVKQRSNSGQTAVKQRSNRDPLAAPPASSGRMRPGMSRALREAAVLPAGRSRETRRACDLA